MLGLNGCLDATTATVLLQASGNRLPIKVSPQGSRDTDGQVHWSKAIMTGIVGDRAVYRPIMNHGKDETALLQHCRLWKSKMDITTQQAVKQLEHTHDAADVKSERCTKLPDQTTDLIFDGEPLEQTTVTTANGFDPPTNPPVAPIAQTPLTFDQKVDLYHNVGAELLREAETKLRQLRSDREQAADLLKSIDDEISTVQQLVKKLEGTPPDLPQSAHKVSSGRRSKTEIAEYESVILNYIKSHPGTFYTVAHLRNISEYDGAASTFNKMLTRIVKRHGASRVGYKLGVLA